MVGELWLGEEVKGWAVEVEAVFVGVAVVEVEMVVMGTVEAVVAEAEVAVEVMAGQPGRMPEIGKGEVELGAAAIGLSTIPGNSQPLTVSKTYQCTCTATNTDPYVCQLHSAVARPIVII